MKRNITLLAALGALLALMVPASSSASMYPAGHKFEIVGGGANLKLSAGLTGSCTVGKIAGQIPAAPKNEEAGFFAISTPTVGTCTSGVSLAFAGEWQFNSNAWTPVIQAPKAESVTLRFSSLPGCKLTNPSTVLLLGIWSNGATAPHFLKSAYHAHRAFNLTWANDGSSCALSGQTELVTWGESPIAGGITGPAVALVNDVTNPAALITTGVPK
jgi:hypothetical protein